jgi:hypothetical protein
MKPIDGSAIHGALEDLRALEDSPFWRVVARPVMPRAARERPASSIEPTHSWARLHPLETTFFPREPRFDTRSERAPRYTL